MKPSRTILGILVLSAVGLLQADSLLAQTYVTVNLEAKYKNNGDYKKLKVKASNDKPLDLRNRGYICIPTSDKACTTETKLQWEAIDLKDGITLKIEVKNAANPNNDIFDTPITLSAAAASWDSGAPIPPVEKRNTNKYYPFIYKVTVYQNGTQIDLVDPDIMPHPP